MKREQIQALYQTVGRNPPSQIAGNVWDEFYSNRNPDFHAAFNLLQKSDFAEIKISSWVFSPESVKAPWVKTQFDEWLKDNPLEGLTFKLSKHPKNRDRSQEGHLIDIHIPLDFQSNDQSSIFRDWFSRFSRFVEELPGKWLNTGLQWNRNNKEEIQRYLATFFINEPQIDNPNDEQTRETVPEPPEGEKSSNSNLDPHNLIFFGAPGTGKSHKLNEAVKKFGDRYERVTFYPTYSYAQFVGCYKPVMKPKVGGAPGEEAKTDAGSASNISIEELAQKLKQAYDAAANAEPGQTAAVLLFAEQYIDALNAQGKSAAKSVVEKAGLPVTAYTAWLAAGIRAAAFKVKQSAETDHEEVSYKFVPGPFLRLLVKALNDPAQDYCLVIEEINRANAAAVFGDVFQLLDRTTQDSNDGNVKKGESEYDIAASEDIKKFLKKNGIESDKLRIPANMYIWATMNSADQGVFPMDTAFKRRWEFEYIGINQGITPECENKWMIDGTTFKWNDFRVFINGLLSLKGVNEDKLMGPWFVKPEKDSTVSAKQFQSKVLMYLWEDAARMCRKNIFKDDITTFSQLVGKWDGRVKSVFKTNEENMKNLADDSRKAFDRLAPKDDSASAESES